ncbi:MAG: hypothetical protein GXO82_04240, partial [Chlorobi bacterium]|nr:hypothetical protein [Chlorobiota bacterium]
ELFLDGRRVALTGNPDVRFISFPSGEKKAEVQFTPTLEDGYHILAVNARDASGNLAGDDFYQVRFIVSREARVDNVFLYPNPASGPAVFSFRAIGEKAPTEGKIKIYTVAGRLIRILEIPDDELRIGFNRVEWDGLDQDADPLANGVYFYKLILKDESGQKEFLEKMAILR